MGIHAVGILLEEASTELPATVEGVRGPGMPADRDEGAHSEHSTSSAQPAQAMAQGVTGTAYGMNGYITSPS